MLDDVDRVTFVRRVAAIGGACGWTLHTACLLDTHYHGIVETSEPNLGRGMQRLLGGYAWIFNHRHGRDGHLFHGPFWSRRVHDDAHLLTACVYVVLNPAAAGLCRHPSDWLWSSYREIVSGRGSDRLLGLFGDSPTQRIGRYVQVVDEATALVIERRAEDGRSVWEASRTVVRQERLGSG